MGSDRVKPVSDPGPADICNSSVESVWLYPIDYSISTSVGFQKVVSQFPAAKSGTNHFSRVGVDSKGNYWTCTTHMVERENLLGSIFC